MLNNDTLWTHCWHIESYVVLCMICSNIFVIFLMASYHINYIIINLHLLREFIVYYLCFIPGHTIGSPTPLSPVYCLDGLLIREGAYLNKNVLLLTFPVSMWYIPLLWYLKQFLFVTYCTIILDTPHTLFCIPYATWHYLHYQQLPDPINCQIWNLRNIQ